MSKKQKKKKIKDLRDPTPRMKRAFEIFREELESGEFTSIGDVMVKAGYAEKTAHNPKQNLTSREGWKKLLATYDMEDIMNNIYDIAKQDEDKRSAIQAAKVFIKANDFWPSKKHKIGQLTEQEKVFD